jgi:ankyrin repeat protein
MKRNHNYIAQQLLERNENGTFKPRESLDEAARKVQDEDIFQTAKLVNCATFTCGIYLARCRYDLINACVSRHFLQ